MNPEKIRVTSQGQGWAEATEHTEALGAASGLDKKETLRLRLLAEELIGLMRGITGDMEADYEIGQKEKNFQLRLTSDVKLTREMHRELLTVATSGKNAAAQGFMGKLRELIAVTLLPTSESLDIMAGLSLGLMTMGSPTGAAAGADSYVWSLNDYREKAESKDARQELEELQKSIVASIADEVRVSVKGSHVEITIFKAF